MKQFLVRILIGVASVRTLFIGYTPDSNAADWHKPDSFQVWSFYGKSTWTTVGPDLDDNYTWANISLCAGKRVYPWLAVSAGLGPGYLKSHNAGNTPSAEFRLMGHFTYKYLYFDLGGGFAYLFDRDDLPDLAKSDLYGLFSGSVGVEIFRLTGEHHNFYGRAGYRIDHISSPFHKSREGDTGVTIGAIEVNFGWAF